MGLQRFRADEPDTPKANGSVMWRTRWIGGPSPALIRQCPTPFGPRTVYITGEPDTFFSIPAVCTVRRKRVVGYVTRDEHGWNFHSRGGGK